jgi:hypothetical protein
LGTAKECLGLGVDAVVAFSVGDGGRRGAGERSTRLAGGDSNVELIAAAYRVLLHDRRCIC